MTSLPRRLSAWGVRVMSGGSPQTKSAAVVMRMGVPALTVVVGRFVTMLPRPAAGTRVNVGVVSVACPRQTRVRRVWTLMAVLVSTAVVVRSATTSQRQTQATRASVAVVSVELRRRMQRLHVSIRTVAQAQSAVALKCALMFRHRAQATRARFATWDTTLCKGPSVLARPTRALPL